MSPKRSRHPGGRGWRPALSVRWRMTLWYLMILSLVMIVFGGVVYETQSTDINAQLNDELRNAADNLASSYDPANGQFDFNDPAGTASKSPGTPPSTPLLDKQTLAALKESGQLGAGSNSATPAASEQPVAVLANSSPPLVALGAAGVTFVANPGGQILTRYGPVSDADLGRLADQAAAAGRPRAGTTTFIQTLNPSAVSDKSVRYRFYTTPLLVKDMIFGTLVVGMPDNAPTELHRLLATLLVAAPITLVIAAAGGYWLATRAMRPVRVMSSTVKTIGATDLSRRLNLSNNDELGDLAGTFDEMLDRLEAAFQRQRRFTSDASHELRTPLTIIQLELEHALAEKTLSPEVAHAFVSIRSENEYMSRLVNDLLIFARAEAGHAAMGRQVVDLSDLVLTAVERLAPLARDREIILAVDDVPQLDVLGDPAYLTQMLSNVIENAIRYSAGHGRFVHIGTGERSEAGGRQAWVRVADDGPGIAGEHLSHLFERFYRLDQARSRAGGPRPASESGSGLGLSIVQWVAREHGGDVHVESTVGQGTIFEIWLPLADSEPLERNATRAPALTNARS